MDARCDSSVFRLHEFMNYIICFYTIGIAYRLAAVILCYASFNALHPLLKPRTFLHDPSVDGISRWTSSLQSSATTPMSSYTSSIQFVFHLVQV